MQAKEAFMPKPVVLRPEDFISTPEFLLSFTLSYIQKEMMERRNRIMQYYHITFRQIMVLAYLERHPNDMVTQKVLETAMGLSNPTVTVLIRTMMDRGLITREQDQEDRRQFRLFMTDKAKEIFDKSRDDSLKVDRTFYKNLTDRDRRSLMRIMEKIKKNLAATASMEDFIRLFKPEEQK